jgi:DNA-binding NtrC family response regulator
LTLEEEMRIRGESGSRWRDKRFMTRVLVIDDDHSVGAAIQMMLARQGCETVLTPDSYAGVEAFESSKFQIVMIDIFMPGNDGLETIKGIRERSPMAPIVAMSGFRFRNSMPSAPDFLGMATKLGATCCLRKPFTPQQLMAAINLCLAPVFPGNCLEGAENQVKDSRDDYGQFPLQYPVSTAAV